MKKVTAVLPARNCRQELQKCLSALSRSSYIPGIIVVDDGSDDGTRQMILEQWPHVTYLPLSAHTGFAHAANAGLRLVQTEYAFLIYMAEDPGNMMDSRFGRPQHKVIFRGVIILLPEPERQKKRPPHDQNSRNSTACARSKRSDGWMSGILTAWRPST